MVEAPYRVIACYDAECWLAMMDFQLVDDHSAITVQALAEPINFPRRQPGCQEQRLVWSGD
jgi:hypothetical protein